MRITNSLFYTNATNDYQRNMKTLYDINTQLSSGMKIQNSYEDSGTFVDAMRLNYEVATLEQVKESSSKAQTYANNTDKTLNQFTDALDQFKTKLIQASSGTHSTTSLDALANELEALKRHMISLGNTSINGQYLFSGSAVTKKPLDDLGNYQGNDESVEAIIGSGVKLPYNINGKDLFLGTDSDYNKVISTNVKMLNQTLLHPKVMQGLDSNPKEEYLSESNTIRDMVGDSDADALNDPKPVFYLSGRNSDGETIKTKFDMSSSSKISDLLEKIGNEFGNTSTNQVVEVSMNAHGQIEVKDLKKGNSLLQMHLFAAVDRNATNLAGSADQSSIDDLLAQNNVDIIEFIKSDFKSVNTASTINSREDIYSSGTFYVGFPMKDSDGNEAKLTTKLQDIMGVKTTELEINGTYYEVNSTSSVSDFINNIEAEYTGVSARIENGQIIVDKGSYSGALSISITARDTANPPLDGSGNLVDAFSTPDAMNYERRGFSKDGNQLSGNISQIIKGTNEYATSSTKIFNVTGQDLDTTSLTLDYKDVFGNSNSATINFLDSGSTFSVNGNTYNIFDSSGVITKADDVTYQQINDIVSMLVSNKLPTDSDTSGTIDFSEYNSAITDAKAVVEVGLDYKGRLEIKDKQNSQTSIEFAMYDSKSNDYSATPSTLNFMANDLITIEEPKIDFYKDLDQMIEAVRNGTFRMDSQGSNPRNIGMQNSIQRLDHLLDHVTKEHTKIGSYSNALSQASDRAQLLSINVQTVRSEVIDVDMGEAYMKFQQLSNSYQAMLSTVAKINSMSLLNYM
ncbi:flagellar hook-associated protein FlgL [Sulfurospirillum sp. 1307]